MDIDCEVPDVDCMVNVSPHLLAISNFLELDSVPVIDSDWCSSSDQISNYNESIINESSPLTLENTLPSFSASFFSIDCPDFGFWKDKYMVLSDESLDTDGECLLRQSDVLNDWCLSSASLIEEVLELVLEDHSFLDVIESVNHLESGVHDARNVHIADAQNLFAPENSKFVGCSEVKNFAVDSREELLLDQKAVTGSGVLLVVLQMLETLLF